MRENKLVVGSQARILYADAEGDELKLQKHLIKRLLMVEISYVILGRDHHDVSGTDSPLQRNF